MPPSIPTASTRRNVLRIVCAAMCLSSALAHAQTFPARQVRILVPFTAGGSSDILARLLATGLRDVWGQAPLIENRAGAGGAIGAELTARATADGYTLLVTDLGTMTILPSLRKDLTWDLHKDLAPLTVISFSPYFVVVTPKLAPKSLQELVDYSKANPGKLNFSAPGIGSNPHLAGLHYATSVGITWTFLPSKGGAQSIQDVAGGHADLVFNSMLATAPHVKSGAVRLLAVTAPKRLEGYTDVPAVAETVPGFTAGSWQGVFTTAGTPREVIAKLNADLVRVLNMPEIRSRIVGMGAEVVANTPEQMDTFLRDDRARWAKVIRENGLKVE